MVLGFRVNICLRLNQTSHQRIWTLYLNISFANVRASQINTTVIALFNIYNNVFSPEEFKLMTLECIASLVQNLNKAWSYAAPATWEH
jgi:hypothetical protein